MKVNNARNASFVRYVQCKPFPLDRLVLSIIPMVTHPKLLDIRQYNMVQDSVRPVYVMCTRVYGITIQE